MDEQKIKQLYEKYAAMVHAKCLAILKDEDSAFDAMQEVFIKLINKPPRTHIKLMAAYLYRMASNISLNILKKQGRITINSEIIEEFTDREDMEGKVLNKMNLENFFKTLDKRDQEIVVLKYRQNRTNIEISDWIGISESAIKKRLHKIRKKAVSLKEVFQYE